MHDILDLTSRMVHDEEAFNLFYATYYPRLYQYLLVMTKGREETVRDVLQDTMLRVLRYGKPFSEESVFWAWLTRLTRTALIDHIRRQHKMPAQVVAALQEKMAAASAEDTHAHLLSLLGEIVETMATEEWQLLEDCYLREQPQVAVAATHSLSLKALESRLIRIRRKIKEMMLERLKHE
jgi:RNA polymerase sigma-70 factor (ECF subfamily)